MVYTAKEKDFLKAWDRLQEEFVDQEDLIKYIESTWLPCKEEWGSLLY